MSTAAKLCCSAWADLLQRYLFIASGSTMQRNEAGKTINDTMKKEEEEGGEREKSPLPASALHAGLLSVSKVHNNVGFYS